MNDIDRIKDLLFGHEKKALDAITRRLEIPESRTADIADVLPEAVLRSHASDPRLVRALEEPVEECIKSSIRRDPHDFADALFPVIGPAIRKAIADALRSMTQSLNQAIENSLSVRTRFQAWRAGVPLGAYILQRNLIYRVEQAFLIKRADGLLIEHVHHEGAISKDTDAVSAMFTAIQDFIQDSFQEQSQESLTTAELGELNLWAVHGPSAILVCVIRGVPPAGLRNELSEILEGIHLRYGDALLRYNGGTAVAGIDLELERCLLLERREAQGKQRKPIGAFVFLLLVVAALAWWLGSSYADSRRLERYRQALEATPGIVVTELRRDHGQVLVRGLRDPLSAAPGDLAPAANLEVTDLRLELEPYQSLDGPIVERRARRILRPPPGVGLRLDGRQLRISGSASESWRERALAIGAAIPGVDSVDVSAMSLDDAAILAAARAALRPPDGIELTVEDGIARATGTAPAQWLEAAQRSAPSITQLRGLDLDGAEPVERTQAARLIRALDGTEVFFSRNDILASGQDIVLTRLAADLRRLGELGAAIGMRPRVLLFGHADGVGDAQLNAQVEAARVERVARHLVDAGVPADWLERRLVASAGGATQPDPTRRKVVLQIGTLASGEGG